MIKRIFAVFDNKAAAYLLPFYEGTTGQATRLFSDAVNREDTPFSRHPNDFALLELGTWDDESGRTENHAQPIHVAHAVQFVNNPPLVSPSLLDDVQES